MRTLKTFSAWVQCAIGALAIAGVASAGPVSYTFTQWGWTDGAGDLGTLSGTFTGQAEQNGSVALTDLNSFQADLHENGPKGSNSFLFNQANLTAFTFDGSGLSFAAGSAASGVEICSGADTGPICFGISPNSGAATDLTGFFEDLPNFPSTTTLLGSTVTQQDAATAPEPGSVLLSGVAGLILIGTGLWRKRPLACMSERPL